MNYLKLLQYGKSRHICDEQNNLRVKTIKRGLKNAEVFNQTQNNANFELSSIKNS